MATTVELEQLGPAMQRLVDRALPMLYTELRNEVARRVFVKLVDLSPVGNAAVDRHPGKYRASHVPNAGSIKTKVLPDMPSYAVPGEEVVDAAVAPAPAASSVFIANAAASERYAAKGSYAGLLEPGRRQYSRTSSKRTIWIGSEQAPDGIYGPAVRAILAMRATIEASAIRSVKERL
jgi:hypothetical protein